MTFGIKAQCPKNCLHKTLCDVVPLFRFKQMIIRVGNDYIRNTNVIKVGRKLFALFLLRFSNLESEIGTIAPNFQFGWGKIELESTKNTKIDKIGNMHF